MTWPIADVGRANVDAGTDSPASARSELLDLVDKFNLVRNHVTAFAQTLLSRATAALMRTDLGIANHELITVTGAGALSTASTVTAGSGLTVSAGGISVTGGILSANGVTIISGGFTIAAGVATLQGGLNVTAGGASITGSATVAGGLTVTSSGLSVSSGTTNVQALNTNGNVGVTGAITATGNISAYSDERLKRDWRDLSPDFLERLAEVRIGTFSMHGDSENKRYAGASAQSTQVVLPEVIEKDEQGYLSMAYGNAAFVAAVQLAREVSVLREEIRLLKEAA